MFRKARIKLTAWYLLIIMIVSISFSAVIYQVLTNEMERFTKAQQFRLERQLRDGQFIPLEIRGHAALPPFSDPELVVDIKHRLFIILVLINSGIFMLSGIFGYFLAGKTLQPIQDMVDEQNQFITDASHELRTPLTSLKSAIEVHLRDKRLTLEEVKKLLVENIKEVNKLQLLSDELLKLAQYQKPNGKDMFSPVFLSEAIAASIKKVTPLAKKKKISITSKSVAQKIPGNVHDLTDLFVILLDNAIKYSSHKSFVSIESYKTDGSIQISVKDSGMGIDKKDLPHIFDRFYRADSARSKKDQKGYGLGLSIAKKIVENHNGTIRVKSEAGRGSIFTIELPIKNPAFSKQSFFS